MEQPALKETVRVQCKECGGISIIRPDALGQRQIFNCPRCFAVTSRWTLMEPMARRS
jgi:hypothetical protein